MLADLKAIDAGIDHALLTRSEVLVEWVEEHEVPEHGDRWGSDPDPTGAGAQGATAGTSGGSAGAGFTGADELGARRLGRDLDGLLVARPVAIAGEGAPMVSDLGLVDLAAALRRSVVSAVRLVGGICELAYRLPLIWERVRGERVAMWRALRVAEKTTVLPWGAAAEVDAELVTVLGACSWAQVDRCVQAALARYMPAAGTNETGDENAESDAAAAPGSEASRDDDARGVQVYLGEAGTDPRLLGAGGIGLTGIDGILEDADALDLEHAIRDLAAGLAAAGSTESLGARRAKALGMIARGEAPLPVGHGAADPTGCDHASAGAGGVPGSRRQVLLVLHLAEASLIRSMGTGAGGVGRCENTLAPASVDQIKSWCAGAKVKVQPVLDVAAHHPVGSYEIPDRIRAQIHYRDLECVFPHCHTPARSCDLDHIAAYPQGPTCACNLAPLCRRHHRAKTARRWTYLMLHAGTYYWRAPSGANYLVDAHGTHQLPDLSEQGAAERFRRRCPSEAAGQRPTTVGIPRGRIQPRPPPGPDPPPPF